MNKKKNLEIEAKFLLKRIPELIKQGIRDTKPKCIEMIIRQYYVKTKKNIIVRYRREKSLFTGYKYFRTIKKKLSSGVFKENEISISNELFKKRREKVISEIEKIRYKYKSNGLIWEVDKYTDMNLCILEVEVPNSKYFENNYKKIMQKMPKILKKQIIMNVTGMKEFSNFSLGKRK